MSQMEAKILDLIEEESGGDGVTRTTPIEALTLDSLEFLNLMARLEQETGKPVPDEQIVQFQTVGELIDFLSN